MTLRLLLHGSVVLLSLLAMPGSALSREGTAMASAPHPVTGKAPSADDGTTMAANATPMPTPGSGPSKGSGATPSPVPPPDSGGTSRSGDMPPTARFGRNCTNGPGGVRYCASSVLEPMGKNSYETSNLFDGRGATAWVEGETGDGIGVELMLDFGSTRRLAGLEISNGYDKDDRIWSRNGRVARYELAFDDGTTMKAALADRRGLVRLTFDAPVASRWLTLTILGVHRGTKYTDTAISELHPLYAD